MSADQQSGMPERVELFSWPVDLFTRETLLAFLAHRLSKRSKTVIANLNLHALHCLDSSAEMASLIRRETTFVHIDGMPIVWLLKSHGARARHCHRVTYLDWATEALALCEERGWKVGYIGSTPATCEKGLDYFRQRFPALELRGWDGFFDMRDISEGSKLSRTLDEVNAFAPDLLIVGMGMPRQEEFLDLHSDRMRFGVAVCAGAFFEYFTGAQKRPPRILGRMGLEWFYRLAFNPRRYGKRYLAEPFVLARNILRLRWRKAARRA